MTSVKFNRNNSIYWASNIYAGEVFLRGKGLYDHLVSEKPRKTDSSSLWEQEDNQIMSLMLTSIEPSIGSTLLYLRTAKAIWERLEHMYSGSGNLSRIYEVCNA